MRRRWSPPPWVRTLYWGSAGALVAFGVAGLATIGVLLLVLAGVLVVVAVVLPGLRPPCVPGLLVGLSTAPLFIAWLNRGGPGLVCTTTPTEMACVDQWSPWPFVATGVLLAAGGLGLLVTSRRVPSRASEEAAATAPTRPRT